MLSAAKRAIAQPMTLQAHTEEVGPHSSWVGSEWLLTRIQ